VSRALARVTCEPARILGIEAGTLSPGAPADICVFDPQGSFHVSRESIRSQGKNTSFLGVDLPGRVRFTLIDGHLAYSAAFA